MKKLFLLSSIIFFAFAPQFIKSAFAQTANSTAQTNTNPPTTINPTRQEIRTTKLDERVANLMQRADTEITRRIDALNKINTRLSTIKHLTDAQKSSFSSQITTEITNLTNLKTKIDADTDITTLREDVKSIVTSYRVFALFIPQIQIIGAADRILNISETMNDFATKLASRITEAKNSGKDTTSLDNLLTDMQNKIAEAKTQSNNVISTVAGLTPDGYPGNKSDLQSARKMLQTARQDLVNALQDARSIIQGLRAFNMPNTTNAPSTTAPTSVSPEETTPKPTS